MPKVSKEKKHPQQCDETERYVIGMPNVLYSNGSKFAFVWVPKCACSSVRQFFMNWQTKLNPYFEKAYGTITYHDLHKRKTFQVDAEKLQQLEHTFVFFRHPVHRFVSNFYNKHVLQKDSKYFYNSNYQKFRCWMEMKNKSYTLHTLLEYIYEFGNLDIHDTPFYQGCLFPEWLNSVSINKNNITYVNVDKSSGISPQIEPGLRRLSIFYTTSRKFHEFKPLLMEFPRLNHTSLHPSFTQLDKDIKGTDMSYEIMLHLSIETWREWYVTHNNTFPPYTLWSLLESHPFFLPLYRKDLSFFYENFSP
jgi:hypothetical protein